MININEISKKYMIILREAYASEAGVSGMKKVKIPLNLSSILKNLMECKVKPIRLYSMIKQ